jgi:hyperosmotically inducible protein
MLRVAFASLALCVSCSIASAQAPPPLQTQPGAAEKLGETIDRGLSQLGAELSQAWTDVRRSVERMGVQGRVFGRLHWDKALQGAKLDVTVREGQVVVLTGTVTSSAAKVKAEELTRDTVDVRSVVNELVVAGPR